MNKKYKIIALIGKSGSGKDTILKRVLKKISSLNEIISCTTRPPRENEKDGVNYYFVTHEEFTDKTLNNEMLEVSCFNDWFYGTSLSSLDIDKVNIGVFNPDGIDAMLTQKSKIDLYVYCIEVNDKERLLRQLNREENPNVKEIIRRFYADEKDFEDLDFHYNYLKNDNIDDLDNNINIMCAVARALDEKN